jgi:hypothetical protein
VPKTLYSRGTRSWEVIPDHEPGADVTIEISERRKRLKQQNQAFVERLRAAIVTGLETPSGVLGQEYGPRLRRHS